MTLTPPVIPDDKSSGYINSLTQYDFDFSKTIAGNQGDKNKRFDFTLNITGANPGTYRVITNDVTGNPTSITVGANGTATGEYRRRGKFRTKPGRRHSRQRPQRCLYQYP